MTEEGERLRRGAGSLTQRDLVRYAESLGWTIDRRRGKGSHIAATMSGRRTVTIPVKPARRTALAILSQLEGG
ncbi:MAG: type II toxin-antitoxin system HicA family toxin [Dehalococcoidia bacterium]